jgi:hypothetical protein
MNTEHAPIITVQEEKEMGHVQRIIFPVPSLH